ncbi:DUF2269 family protein [Paenibacillus sp. LMG 31461]|uniref:DUF2269 family protein n=1 Tax=Paenibacillus plantarum TaxID=2654975 RepID=A0ABX1XBJ6_9BACL|nr:DUF2269 family protein [Paenibacillus plantarum]NOU65747.1 DUF2269 family protein [Paenibacillus plantarum]
MKWLVLIHIVSAIVGIGPTYFGHILLRRNQKDEQLQQSLALFQKLNYFPKIGGSIAVVTGVALVAFAGWKFSDLWILISLVLYVLIQFVAVGVLTPVMSQLNQLLSEEDTKSLNPERHANKSLLLTKANRLYNAASIMGIVLIILMIAKPM